MIVYLILNTVNCKGYVGKHKGDTISTRWDKKLSGANDHLEKAKKKYGLSSFHREILGVAGSEEELTALERLWIIALRTYDPDYGYNMTYGGEGGQFPTEELVEKRASANRGRIRSEQTRANMREAHRLMSKEDQEKRNAKISAALTGKKLKEETKEKIRLVNLGKKQSKVSRLKQSATNRAKGIRPPSNKGKFHSEETKETMSKTRLARIAAGLIVPPKGTSRSEETRARMRAAWIVRKSKQSNINQLQ